MPADWRSEYLATFREQEKHNPVNLEIVQLCSQLSDRIAALEAEKEVLKSKLSPATSNAKASAAAAAPDAISSDPTITQLQLHLAEALRSNGTLQTRAKSAEEELQVLHKKTREDARQVKQLTEEKTDLARKLRDREHELREKRKLVENVQDEMITLNLQVTMAEQERNKVKKENKELVDRWMKRMAQEAEAMNLANER
ncbi:Autophagy-related protein 16 [Colletotrichum orbiculare MAFF 240422]|uniref:Autophagy-related protein 16 n=1 Tax=Colletotrichum orbiculare (strain 104-T / ATCC 96160 / CBS 514.97 / LARS 414 / MAFF 240422) TaxID=1213857 RepID=N4VR35_COLOR|nr:Autophagy-related protein 16 [Colletotrichum orbiculare MAFF 240422]